MKKLFLLLLGAFPTILFAQNNCDFFENVEITMGKTELNTSNSDFGPSFVNDKLWFSAYTEDEIGRLAEGKKVKDIFYNLYNSAIDGDGIILEPRKIVDLEKITEGYHAGPVSYCAETKELFVTLSNFEDPEMRNRVFKKADIHLKTIILKEEDGIWKLKEELPFNSSLYSVGHPAISKSGDMLLFTSDVPDKGVGGTDIYVAFRKNGNWGEMINLGNTINTEKNEMFPFIFKENMLIYASNGLQAGKNDLDLYYSCYVNDEFTAPKKLDELCTDEDDFGLVIHENEEIGYFASRRPDGAGDDDIYKVKFDGKYELELMVLDKKTKEPILNASVGFDDNISGVLDGTIIKRPLKKNSNYVAAGTLQGYLPASKSFTTVGKPFGVIKETMLLEKHEKDLVVTLENIYYDFDKWNIRPDAEPDLKNLIKLMNEYPKMKVELRSHTDSRGSDAYNEILSQKRAESAVAYIIKGGIQKERIVAKGYGEKELVNECANGVECSKEAHQQNRRTEFKILSMK